MRRTTLVTGGAKGLGAAIACAFHEQGDHVVIASRYRSETVLNSDRIRFIPCDVRKPADLLTAARLAVEWTGQLDTVINNAGVSAWRKISEVDETFWNEIVDTNLKGCFFGCQAAAEVMQEGASIVNISSLAGKRGSANNAVYCASKFGVNGITQALAKELGPRGIRVNAVCPVYIRTDGLLSALREPQAPPLGTDPADYLREFASVHAALGRMPQASEVAQVCLFLSSPAASAVTGQCLNVDCGVLPQ